MRTENLNTEGRPVKVVITVKRFAFLAIATLFAMQAAAISEAKKEAIAERIKPVGTICLQGDDCAAAAVVATAGPKDPSDIYSGNCAGCHDTGAAGAPKVGDAASWAPHLAKGIDALYTNAINGIGAMPAKGLCMSCSDDEIKATIDLMISKSE